MSSMMRQFFANTRPVNNKRVRFDKKCYLMKDVERRDLEKRTCASRLLIMTVVFVVFMLATLTVAIPLNSWMQTAAETAHYQSFENYMPRLGEMAEGYHYDRPAYSDKDLNNDDFLLNNEVEVRKSLEPKNLNEMMNSMKEVGNTQLDMINRMKAMITSTEAPEANITTMMPVGIDIRTLDVENLMTSLPTATNMTSIANLNVSMDNLNKTMESLNITIGNLTMSLPGNMSLRLTLPLSYNNSETNANLTRNSSLVTNATLMDKYYRLMKRDRLTMERYVHLMANQSLMEKYLGQVFNNRTALEIYIRQAANDNPAMEDYLRTLAKNRTLIQKYVSVLAQNMSMIANNISVILDRMTDMRRQLMKARKLDPLLMDINSNHSGIRPSRQELDETTEAGGGGNQVDEEKEDGDKGNTEDDDEFGDSEEQEDENMLSGLIGAFLSGLSNADGNIDIDAITGLIGSLSAQQPDGTYDFSGLTDILMSFFGGDGTDGGSDFGAFLGGLVGAFIQGVAQPPGARGAGIFVGNLVTGILPALFGPAPQVDGEDRPVANQGLDLGGFISGILQAVFGASASGSLGSGPGGLGSGSDPSSISTSSNSGGDGGDGSGSGGGSKFSLFKGIFSIITSLFTSSSGSSKPS